MKKNKKSNILLWLFLLYIIFTVILAAVHFLGFLFSDSITEEYSTIDIANYGVWDGHIECERDELKSKLAIFPNTIENAEEQPITIIVVKVILIIIMLFTQKWNIQMNNTKRNCRDYLK